MLAQLEALRAENERLRWLRLILLCKCACFAAAVAFFGWLQTYEEMLAELEEAEGDAAVDGDDEEEEEYVYNPLKLPLGWDGKPIPYWLYKLHGLNQEFKCEICGNYRCGARN